MLFKQSQHFRFTSINHVLQWNTISRHPTEAPPVFRTLGGETPMDDVNVRNQKTVPPKMAVKPCFAPMSSLTTNVDVCLSPSPCPICIEPYWKNKTSRLLELDFSPFKKDTNMLLAATSSRTYSIHISHQKNMTTVSLSATLTEITLKGFDATLRRQALCI